MRCGMSVYQKCDGHLTMTSRFVTTIILLIVSNIKGSTATPTRIPFAFSTASPRVSASSSCPSCSESLSSTSSSKPTNDIVMQGSSTYPSLKESLTTFSTFSLGSAKIYTTSSTGVKPTTTTTWKNFNNKQKRNCVKLKCYASRLLAFLLRKNKTLTCTHISVVNPLRDAFVLGRDPFGG